MARQLYSVSALATELCRDRRTVGEALRSVRPDGELKGRSAFYMTTAIEALYGEKAGARERKLAAEARLAELELDERLGTVVRIDEALTVMTACAMVVRNKCLALPSKLASIVPPEARRAVFDVSTKEVHGMLTELSEMKIRGTAQAPEVDIEEEEPA